jgi:hypothetical protein
MVNEEIIYESQAHRHDLIIAVSSQGNRTSCETWPFLPRTPSLCNLNINVYPGTAVAISTEDTVARQSEYFRLPGDSCSHLDEDIVAV